jgi:hypothetical protein
LLTTTRTSTVWPVVYRAPSVVVLIRSSAGVQGPGGGAGTAVWAATVATGVRGVGVVLRGGAVLGSGVPKDTLTVVLREELEVEPVPCVEVAPGVEVAREVEASPPQAAPSRPRTVTATGRATRIAPL